VADPIHLRVFLSSPGDVPDERGIARTVVEQLQYDPFVRGRVTFDVVAWDTPGGGAPMLATETPQESVNRGLPRPSECDIVVVVLWSRMGTPLPFPGYRRPDGSPYLSGTEWEYEDAIGSDRPTVLVYRRTTTVLLDLDARDVEERLRQKRLVDGFFARMRDPATGVILRGHKKYGSPDRFRAEFEQDLKSLVHRMIGAAAGDSADTGAAGGAGGPVAVGPPPWSGSPFPGLRAFTPSDAPIFFGRGRETDELTARVTASPFVAVVGASGSGKSSLVGAGLIPRLATGTGWTLPGYDAAAGRWTGSRFTPGELGDDPFLATAAVLAGPGGHPAALAAELAAAPESVVDHLPDGTSLVFVDQFEELFTMADPATVLPWVRLVDAAARSGRCHVVVTLRADFYHRCLELPLLARLLETGQLPLAAPTDTLLEMITRPAERADLAFEEGLPGRILRDAGGDPDALPLLAYTLDELYRAATTGRLLDFATYLRLGGVQGAVGTRAEHVFSSLPDSEARATFARVFRELVSVDAHGRVTRRRTPLSRLPGGLAGRRLVDVFTQARLLVQSRDERNRPVVYVAHEALFGTWARLADWIAAMREDLLLEHKVTTAAAEWAQNGRDDAFRWPHERLEPVYAMVARLGTSLDPVTAEFVEPEHERLVPLLRDAALESHRRQNIVDRLVAIGAMTVPGLLALLTDTPTDTSGAPAASAAPTSDTAASGTATSDTAPSASDTAPPGGAASEAVAGAGVVVARGSAATALARLGEPAVPGLAAALDHPDPQVRLAAVGALRLSGARSAAAALAPALGDRDAAVRSAAVGALTSIGDPTARGLLGAAAAGADADVRWLAAGSLGAFGPEAVPFLLAVDPHDDQAVESARRALAAIGEQALEPLLTGLRRPEPHQRVHAGRALAAIGAAAVPGLVTALTDPDADVRWQACEILAAIADRTCEPALLTTLDDAEPMVRAAAARALGELRATDAAPHLVAMLADDDHTVTWAAAGALARVGPPAAAVLVSALRTPAPGASMMAAALSGCGNADLVAELGADRPVLRALAAEVLARPDVNALPVLLTALDEPTRSEGAERALALIGPRSVPGLIDLVDHGSPVVRCAAARTLGRIGADAVGGAYGSDDDRPLGTPSARHALGPLGELLGHDDQRCRTAAADALARFGRDALPVVWRLLSGPEPARSAAARSAVGIGAAAVPGLLALVGNDDTAQAAVAALRAIGTPAALFGLAELGLAQR
jgi:HEAT repeat protein